MGFVHRMAHVREGAERLSDSHILQTLADCKCYSHRPEEKEALAVMMGIVVAPSLLSHCFMLIIRLGCIDRFYSRAHPPVSDDYFAGLASDLHNGERDAKHRPT